MCDLPIGELPVGKWAEDLRRLADQIEQCAEPGDLYELEVPFGDVTVQRVNRRIRFLVLRLSLEVPKPATE